MFDFLCERSFESYATDGVVTLPAVAPMVEGVLESLGRTVSSADVYKVWTQHCDPDMRHMSLQHFRPFLRALLEDYLQEEPPEHTMTVTQPLLMDTGYPELEVRTLRAEQLPPAPAEPVDPLPEPCPVPEAKLTPTAAPKLEPRRRTPPRASSLRADARVEAKSRAEPKKEVKAEPKTLKEARARRSVSRGPQDRLAEAYAKLEHLPVLEEPSWERNGIFGAAFDALKRMQAGDLRATLLGAAWLRPCRRSLEPRQLSADLWMGCF